MTKESLCHIFSVVLLYQKKKKKDCKGEYCYTATIILPFDILTTNAMSVNH